VKAWARARGLDSAPFGGLPGLAWAVLAARTVREHPAGTPAGVLLREFFGSWAAWDWRDPVGLMGRAGGSGDPVTVLTPSAPVRSCTAQVGAGMRDLLVRELFRAWELLEEGPAGYRAAAVRVPPLHRRHAAWAVVTVRGAEHVGRTRGRLRALLGALEEAGITDAHAWPHPVPADASAPEVIRYAIGLGAAPPDRARLAALTAPWVRGVPGVEVAWAAGGDVPDLRAGR
jgi:hypothetical protein